MKAEIGYGTPKDMTSKRLNIRIISAGAGSGKTYRLTSELVSLLKHGVRPSGTIATTFTNKAAAELQERVRVRLLEEGLPRKAEEITNALIGTVHSLGVKLLKRFAFEAGVSPDVSIMAEEDRQVMFNQSLAVVLTDKRVRAVEALCDKLGLNKREHYDWRREVRQLTDIARINNFSFAVLEESKRRSFETFRVFLDPSEPGNGDVDREELLLQQLDTAIERLTANEDKTKKTANALAELKQLKDELALRGHLFWHHWIKISKLAVGVKSREDIAPLREFVQSHLSDPVFHDDIRSFIEHIFDISTEALREYDQYKRSRGLIDYTDMEVKINDLLDLSEIQEILTEELDLLMVDEFQDTSPLQLEIFLKLSRLAGESIWVGDPKQSIYGFRGAEPQLMKAVVQGVGGVREEDIQEHSWRSREDLVAATNALFTKAFAEMPVQQVALKPKRTRLATPKSINQENEPIEMGDPLVHWYFEYDGPGRRSPRKPWLENCIASALREWLAEGVLIQPKDEKDYRRALPGDVAVLCRSNAACQTTAEALSRAGFKVAIAQSGLLETAEAKAILACLKYLLNKYDTLSVAEILVLIANVPIEEVIQGRMTYLRERAENSSSLPWAGGNPYIDKLNRLREEARDLTSAEILNLVIEELSLRPVIASWGKTSQRLDNLEELRRFAIQYEDNCNRLHSASSLGGFLLWLSGIEKEEKDMQGAGRSSAAVNVMTYHKSKGLEWPIVICHSLEGHLRAQVWGVKLINDSAEVNLENVLGNRWIRYWINPYGDQVRNTLLEERIKEHEVFNAASSEALMEDARLLYVGITRARDYVVFPTRDIPTRWLNRVWHRGDDDAPTLDESTFESPWEWEGKWLPKYTETKVRTADFTHHEITEGPLRFLEPPAGKKEYPAAVIDLRLETVFSGVDFQMGKVSTYNEAWEPTFGAEPYDLAKALKAMMVAETKGLTKKELEDMAASFIASYDLGGFTSAPLLARRTGRWQQWLDRSFAPVREYRKFPVRYFHQGRQFETVIDLMLETNEGIVLIQNSGYAGQQKQWRQKAKELAPWFLLSKMAVGGFFGKENVRTLLHFVLGGGIVEVIVERDS